MQKILLVCFLCLISGTRLSAQSNLTVEQIIDNLSSYNEQFPKEKVYLHLDRSHYSPGDDIWFKGYVTIGNLNMLSQHSKLIDVELLGPNDELIQSIRLPLSAGITFGDFSLSNTLSSGLYRIRAYTQWMRNFDDNYFFEKELNIIEPLSLNSASELKKNKTRNSVSNRKKGVSSSQDSKINKLFNIELYPESGYYSLGNSNKVIIKATKNTGQGIATTGWLKNGEGKNTIELKTDENGLGSFVFIAEDSDYSIILKDEDRNDVSFPFTIDNMSGYGLAVKNYSDSNLFVQIRLDQKEVNGQELNLLVHQQGEVFYALKVKAQKPESVVNIPKNILGDGIIEIVLLSGNMTPLASRKVFNVTPTRLLPIEVQMNKKHYTTREKVKVDLISGFEMDSLRIASFSTAVTHQEKVPWTYNKEENIQSYLLLQAGVKEKVKAVSSYFTDHKKPSLDELMLTLDKDDVWNQFNKMEIKFPPEKSIQVSGLVTRINEKKPEPFAKVSLFSAQARIVLDTLADENGRFVFDHLFFYDSVQFVVQARGENGRKYLKIHLDNENQGEIKKSENNTDVSVSLNDDDIRYLENNKDRINELSTLQKGIVLSDVKIDVKINKAPNSSNLNGPGNADQILNWKELETCSSLDICLQGRLMGVVFRNGIPYSTRSMNTPMGVIIDGMRMEGEDLSMVNPGDVETIEVLRNIGYLAVYGPFGSGGVIVVTTKRGNGSYNTSSYTPGLVTYDPKGYYKVREFVSPDYSLSNQSNIQKDLRSTIYWKPNLVSNEEGKTSFEFYTSDQPGKYRIIIQGIDIHGRLGYSIVEFEVNKN